MNLIKKTTSTILVMMLMLTIVTAQSRYKHIPRVKVDVNRIYKTLPKQEVNSSITTTTNYMSLANSTSVEKIETTMEETIVVSSSEDEVIIPITKKKTIIHKKKVVKNKSKTEKQLFTQKIKENSKFLDVKDVNKTNANVPLILLIVFYVLAFIFLLIAILMIVGAIYYTWTLFLVFLIIGLTFLLAGSLLLTLMKFGLV